METLRRHDRTLLLQWARDAEPLEACGFILDDGSAVMVPNIATEHNQFVMDKETVIALHSHRGRFAAVWHSHPEGQQHPSSNDCEHHPRELPMLIVTLESIWEWNLSSGVPIRVGEL